MKRFYKDVAIEAADGGYIIQLDGRTVKTPNKETLLLPTEALANAVADEWCAQDEEIDTASMPMTKLANTALDRVAQRFEEVAADISNFGGTDLLCYRAEDPPELAARQAKVWDPYLDWAKETLGAELVVTDGIMPIQQSDEALAAISDKVSSHSAFELTALHEFTNGFGSVVIGLAFMAGFVPFEEAWQASILDQMHQEEAWGEDYEAAEKKEKMLQELTEACKFLSQVRN